MKVKIPDKYFDLLIRYAKTAYARYGTEVSGFAPIVVQDNNLVFLEPKVLKQSCTPALTTINKEAFNEYMIDTLIELKEQGYEHDQIVQCWWHSHHTMDAFWSGTDHACIKQYAEEGPIFALVVNNKRQYKFAYAETRTIAGSRQYCLEEPELKVTTNPEELAVIEELVSGESPVVRKEQMQIQERTAKYNWFGDKPLTRDPEDWSPEDFQDELENDSITDAYNEDQETLDFNKSFEPPTVPTFTPRTQVRKIVAKKPQAKPKKKDDKPKRKGVRSLKSLDNKLNKLEVKNQAPVPKEYILQELTYLIGNLIQDFHTKKTKLTPDECLSEVQLASKEYNDIAEQTLLHVPSDINETYTFQDLLIKPQRNKDVSNHREIQQYIQTAGSQI